MEGTCDQKCPFWKKYKERCPFYLKTTWQKENEPGQVSVVDDCAPKRSLYMLMNLEPRLIGIQKAAEEERNSHEKFTQSLLGVLELATKEPGRVRLTIPIEVVENVGSREKVSEVNSPR